MSPIDIFGLIGCATLAIMTVIRATIQVRDFREKMEEYDPIQFILGIINILITMVLCGISVYVGLIVLGYCSLA